MLLHNAFKVYLSCTFNLQVAFLGRVQCSTTTQTLWGSIHCERPYCSTSKGLPSGSLRDQSDWYLRSWSARPYALPPLLSHPPFLSFARPPLLFISSNGDSTICPFICHPCFTISPLRPCRHSGAFTLNPKLLKKNVTSKERQY